jgi:prepilin-type processing-associated H-X9-DG protein
MSSGGTDYGANVGYGNAFQDVGAGSTGKICKHPFGAADDFLYSFRNPDRRCAGPTVPWRSTKVSQITDGTSQTILLGELQRTTYRKEENCSFRPNDGWAIGGVSNMFDTQLGTINDTFFESPGSDHPGGAQFAMSDGSVQYFTENIDSDTLRSYSSMDGEDFQKE